MNTVAGISPNLFLHAYRFQSKFSRKNVHSLVEEGVLDDNTIQQWLQEHTSQMSQAFQSADSYVPSGTDTYRQMGEDQMQHLKASR